MTISIYKGLNRNSSTQISVNPFEGRIFPTRAVDLNGDGGHHYFIYHNELYPKRILTFRIARTPGTATNLPVILEPSPGR